MGKSSCPHYFIITIGTIGDIHPFLSIATALQALGKKVTFVTTVNHERLVQDAGIAFIGFGTEDEYARIIKNPNLWEPRKSFSALMVGYSDWLRQIYEAIETHSQDAHCVAIAHPFTVPAAAIARERGLIKSVIAMHLAPSSLRTCHDPLTIGPLTVPSWVPMQWRRALWRFVEKRVIDPVAVSRINAVRSPLGLPKINSLLTHIAQSPNLTVTLFPTWFAPIMPDWPHPLIAGDFPLFEARAQDGFSHDLSAFLAAGTLPLVFTAGTANHHAADFFDNALNAVNHLGCRAIFLTKDRSQVPTELPETVLWQAYVPLSALLPHAAVLVHHGGIGTTAEALRSGTPQLIVPFAWDQFDNGARIKSLGVGRVIPAKNLRPRTLAKHLKILYSSEAVRARCLLLASHFKHTQDPVKLCEDIDRLSN